MKQEVVLIKMLADSIIMHRMLESLKEVNQILFKNKNAYEDLVKHVNGVKTVLLLMGIAEENPIYNSLIELFNKLASNKDDSNILAIEIYNLFEKKLSENEN